MAATTCRRLQLEGPNMPNQQEREVAFAGTSLNQTSHKTGRNWQETTTWGYEPAGTGNEQERAGTGTWTRQNWQEPAGTGICFYKPDGSRVGQQQLWHPCVCIYIYTYDSFPLIFLH